MRPYQTITILILALIVGAYFYFRVEPVDQRVEKFVDCYIDLALLHQRGDTARIGYTAQKDSVLGRYGFTEQSLKELKTEFNRDPLLMADIWGMINEKLKAHKEELELKK